MGKASEGRVVLNHSTHVPGLIPILERLARYTGVGTVTPGVIRQAKGHIPTLQLKLSVPILGGFKAIARRGRTVQEVFILTELSQEQLEWAIAQVINR